MANAVPVRSTAPLRRPDGVPIVGRATVRAAVAIAEAVFARKGTPPPPERLAWLALEIEDFLARVGPAPRLLLWIATWVVATLGPLFVGRLALVGSLPLPDRVRALESVEARVPAPLLAVKGMLCLLYYEHPDAAREVGFDGSCLVSANEPQRQLEERLP